jgi:CelD/BcsL family acetyltransferase involved in cellulose biosynthesis
MNRWHLQDVPFRYQLGDLTLLTLTVPLQVRAERLVDDTPAQASLTAPADALAAGSRGFLVRGLPIGEGQPVVGASGDYICYVAQQYQHCYIDLGSSFEDYAKKFSSKTRSTINRKLKKFAEHSGGATVWKTYREPEELRAFFALAGKLSKSTYQDRLLDAGLPDSEEFIQESMALAAENRLRAYILFDGERPVSYLYCPVHEGVLIYAYVGYHPDFMQLSVGTVLQWLAVEQLFKEACFRYFDFTEGQSDHKRLFATHQRLCGNVFFVKRGVRSASLVRCHALVNRFSTWLGATLERLGVKAKIKRFLRFAR